MNKSPVEPLVKLSNVSQSYDKLVVISNISLEILPRSITTVIGPNGAGKTTLAKIIAGTESPRTGSVKRREALRLSYIPQKLAMDRNLPLDIESFLKLLSQHQATKSMIIEALRAVDMELKLDQSVHNLSGGQFQKLLLTAALLNKPELIIMDEPTQGLDVNSQTNFYKMVEQIRLQHDCAIFMISHDLFTVMSKSQQVICLNKHICCHGIPSQIVNRPEFIEIFGKPENILSLYSHHHDHEH